MNDNQDHFNVLRKIKSKPKSTQRELAEELGFSLGKLNYCLKALINLTGILSKSMTYGQEKVEIQPKLIKNQKKNYLNLTRIYRENRSNRIY